MQCETVSTPKNKRLFAPWAARPGQFKADWPAQQFNASVARGDRKKDRKKTERVAAGRQKYVPEGAGYIWIIIAGPGRAVKASLVEKQARLNFGETERRT